MRFDLVEIIFLLLGSGFVFTKIPQIKKLIKRKTSDDISLMQWCFDTLLVIPWIWYAIYRAESISLVIIYIGLVVSNFTIVYLSFKYRKNKRI